MITCLKESSGSLWTECVVKRTSINTKPSTGYNLKNGLMKESPVARTRLGANLIGVFTNMEHKKLFQLIKAQVEASYSIFMTKTFEGVAVNNKGSEQNT